MIDRYQAFIAALVVAVAVVAVAGCQEPKETDSMNTPQLPTAATTRPAAGQEMAMFAAGCFWGVEAAFRRVDGVVDAAVGYSGGHTKDPTYKQVCTDRTGHAEVVRVVFDPTKTSYAALLATFWSLHDPTTPNRQGSDVGSQYRSAIFYCTPAQAAAAKAAKQRLAESGKLSNPIVTEISPAGEFYRAEEYHQRYVEKNGGSACPTEQP